MSTENQFLSADSPEPPLAADHVSKTFFRQNGAGSRSQRKVEAVKDASVSVARGGVLGIVGESGSGKTTLARCLAGLESPTSGRVLWQGQAVDLRKAAAQRDYWRRLQIVFQNPYATLDPLMKIVDIVREPLENYKVGQPGDREEAAAMTLDSVRLPRSALTRRPGELSGGQRQRVALARALVLAPEVLILDEPVSALDVSVQAQVLRLLADLRESMSVSYVVILHDLAVARQLCDEVAVMLNGQVVETGLAEAVLTSPSHEYTKKLLSVAPKIAQ